MRSRTSVTVPGFRIARWATTRTVHPTYISLVDRGLRDPKTSSVKRIARGLRVGAGELVAEAQGAG